MGDYSKRYGEFKRGVWIPFLKGVRKHTGKTLRKCFDKFSNCPFCGHPVGGLRDTSTINICASCKTPMIVTKFVEVDHGS